MSGTCQVWFVTGVSDAVIEFAITYGFQILGALVFLFVGLKAAGWAGRRVSTITVNKEISGVVDEITLAASVLLGEDGERITVPNKEIVGRVIVNSHGNRVVQTKICIGEGEDARRAVAVLLQTLKSNTDLKDGPVPQVGIHDFTYGGIILGLRFWVPSARYFQVRYLVNGEALSALKEAGIKLLPAGSLAVAASSLSADDEDEESVL